jgi:hypothetical protein
MSLQLTNPQQPNQVQPSQLLLKRHQLLWTEMQPLLLRTAMALLIRTSPVELNNELISEMIKRIS